MHYNRVLFHLQCINLLDITKYVLRKCLSPQCTVILFYFIWWIWLPCFKSWISWHPLLWLLWLTSSGCIYIRYDRPPQCGTPHQTVPSHSETQAPPAGPAVTRQTNQIQEFNEFMGHDRHAQVDQSHVHVHCFCENETFITPELYIVPQFWFGPLVG